MDNINWDDILEDIEEQRAVLLIGHNFLPNAHEALNARLTDKLGDKLQHFYSRDGLFLFNDGDAKTTAQQETARFYRSNPPDEDMLKKIVEMPFRLMISANPDKFFCTISSCSKNSLSCSASRAMANLRFSMRGLSPN